MKLVFTDLDGTLLDHKTYSYKQAQKGLLLLQNNNVPLILVSSKTFPEIKELHKKLKLQSPFIFENGGGIAYCTNDDYQFEILGSPPSLLRKILWDLSKSKGWLLKTILDMEIDELCERTGLSKERAVLARQRKASLPFIFLDNNKLDIKDLNIINTEIGDTGCYITKGGRFYHISSIHANKGNALEGIIDFYQTEMEIETLTTYAIGDSENDISMLRTVDYPFLVKKYDNSSIETGIDSIKITKAIGPAGFSEAVDEIVLTK